MFGETNEMKSNLTLILTFICTYSSPFAGVLVRYTGQPKSFQLLFTGTATDFPALRTKEVHKIQEVVTRITQRSDITILDVTWQGEWR